MNTDTLFLIRDLIAAVVNAINVHSNNPAHLAVVRTDALKAKLADAGLPKAEQAHIDTVLAHLASQPAPVVPVPHAPVEVPEPPEDAHA